MATTAPAADSARSAASHRAKVRPDRYGIAARSVVATPAVVIDAEVAPRAPTATARGSMARNRCHAWCHPSSVRGKESTGPPGTVRSQMPKKSRRSRARGAGRSD